MLMTLSMMTLGIMTLSIMTLRITKLMRMTLSITKSLSTLSNKNFLLMEKDQYQFF